MANIFNILSEETFAEKLDTQNQLLAGILSAQGGSIVPKSFKDIQTLTRAGLHTKALHVGDQLMCSRGDATLVWDVIGLDQDKPANSKYKHTTTIQLHDCLTSLQYDGTEALYYAETELDPGTYSFTLLAGYDTTNGGGKNIQFTLSKAVPAGGQIMFPWAYNTQSTATKVSTYKSRTDNAAIETVAVTEGSGGTSLGVADGQTANMNHTHRIRYGSNNWKESAMRQYLNSDKPAGSVWTPQTIFDRAPSWATNTAGFMNGLDPELLAVVGAVEKVTCRNNVCEGGGQDVTKDKFFLLSRSEINAGKEVSSVDEGAPYTYYTDFSDNPTANTGNDTNRIKYRNNAAQYWWLRSPNAGYGNDVRNVYPAGQLSINVASITRGVAPACCII